jgi:putative mRNA 3-end processing factor
VLAPPGARMARWASGLVVPVTAYASGWMTVSARARASRADLPLILSDHADWAELTDTIAELNPEEFWITHGRDDALARWAELGGRRCRPLHVVGREGEVDA